MTYSSLYKLKLKQFWPMAVLSSISFFLFGPFFAMIRISGNRDVYRTFTQRNLLQRILEVLNVTSIFYDIIAVVLALIFGIVIFRYLHIRKEVDFYHSQPIHRTRLFVSTCLAGLTVLYVPMIVMYLLTLLVAAIFGGASVLSLLAVVMNLCYMILFSLATFSLAVFAGQLTGTVATHTAMAGLLSFIVPITAAVWELAAQLFRATTSYSYEGNLLEASFRFSPIASMLRTNFIGLATYPVPEHTIKMTFVLPEVSTFVIQIGSIIAFTFLSWMLYQKRSSEACGMSMVYDFTEPILKGYVMFIAAFMCAAVVLNFSSRPFFYLSFLLFAVLAHMVCEVILRKDFKAMLGRKKECGVLLLVLFVLLGCLQFDVTGFDRYVPKEEEIHDVHITAFSNWYNYGKPIYNNTTVGITDPETLHLTMNLIHEIADNQYYQSSRINNRELIEGDNYYSDVIILYHLKNGKTVSRCYRNVPLSKVETQYRALSNNPEYLAYIFSEVLKAEPKQIVTMEVHSFLDNERYTVIFDRNSKDAFLEGDSPFPQTADVATEYPETGVSSKERFELASRILQAYQQDLKDRTGDELLEEGNWSPDYEILCWLDGYGLYSTGAAHTDYFSVPVYPCDERTEAVLKNLRNTFHE